ncbi:M23 family metallopeptidase [Alcaligenaceae bacterium CGII-47]|nr:M23 family metallopeptidase [Alcaligenaceae bacterium CGII-47]
MTQSTYYFSRYKRQGKHHRNAPSGYATLRGMNIWILIVLPCLFLALAGASHATTGGIIFPLQVQQGAMVLGKVPPQSQVLLGERSLDVTAYGTVVFGVARDAVGPVQLRISPPGGDTQLVAVIVKPRDWPIERVNGVPPKTVSPPREIAERIQREQARVAQARATSDHGTGFAQAFIWPVKGRISGRFGNQRVYNGIPGAAHSGMDIAAPKGTPIQAPADGRVVFADADLYLTGGTVLIDHGYGIGSNFLHLSRLSVKVGDTVVQGQVIGYVGATGRATGPHLHWGMSWFDVRIDPLLVLDAKG